MSQKGCLLLQVFIIGIEGPAKGVPFVDLFFAFFQKDFDNENSCFEQGDFFDFGKVCFIFVYETHLNINKNSSTTFKNDKEYSKHNLEHLEIICRYCNYLCIIAVSLLFGDLVAIKSLKRSTEKNTFKKSIAITYILGDFWKLFAAITGALLLCIQHSM